MCTLIYFPLYILFCVYWHWISSAILLPHHLQDTSAALCSLLDFSLPALSNPIKERVCHSKNWFDWKSFHLKSQAGKIFILKHTLTHSCIPWSPCTQLLCEFWLCWVMEWKTQHNLPVFLKAETFFLTWIQCVSSNCCWLWAAPMSLHTCMVS